jgi:BirA family biotin operon repressor/biotin-[acetyl-CoA-carboxylase] ligase
MSFILRPGNVPHPELATLVSAVAVARGIREETGLVPTIKWPNDVMVGGRKIAGVIAEAQSFKQELNQIIVGVGVNCNSPVSHIGELKGEATSVVEELGRHEEISALKHSVLDSFSHIYDEWKAGQDVAQAWRSLVGTLGRHVSVKLKTEETAFSCLAREIQGDGNMVADGDQGEVVISAEDLEWLRELD